MPAPEGNQYALGNEGGRPSLYKDDYAELAYNYCLLGATDKDLALFFSVHEDTINEWKKTHEEFSESITRGKTVADAKVARSLFDAANGAQWVEQMAFKVKRGPTEEEVEVVDVMKANPPDVKAIVFWLKNRQPSLWRDKREIVATVEEKGAKLKAWTAEQIDAFERYQQQHETDEDT